MESKPRAGAVPALGRLQLKKVAVPVGGVRDKRRSAPPAQVEPEDKTPPRRVVVAEEDKKVRNAIAALLPRDRFKVWVHPDGDAAYDHILQHGCDLAILSREMPGLSGTVLCELLRNSKKGAGIAVVLMSPQYRDAVQGARDSNAFGADGFFPLPAATELMLARIDEALSLREPAARLQVLPDDVAAELDHLWAELDKLDYYAILGVNITASERDIKGAYHQRSLIFHPDRHSGLRDTHPHIWERCNTVYKRLSEAYQVLNKHRGTYNVGLRKHGQVRLDSDHLRQEIRKAEIARTPAGRREVMEAIECRNLGDLEGALEFMEKALRLEPSNDQLLEVRDAINKLLSIVAAAED